MRKVKTHIKLPSFCPLFPFSNTRAQSIKASYFCLTVFALWVSWFFFVFLPRFRTHKTNRYEGSAHIGDVLDEYRSVEEKGRKAYRGTHFDRSLQPQALSRAATSSACWRHKNYYCVILLLKMLTKFFTPQIILLNFSTSCHGIH